MERADPEGAPTADDTLEAKLKLLPDRPGVYLFRDEAGTILYVGKAVSLRNRVRSYFHAGRGLEAKTQALVALVRDFEFIVTDSEVEALLLESNLIKEHRPKYNIRLRDDKQYPYLRLDLRHPWPKLELVRSVRADGARYFGPFPHSSAVWETMQILRRVFPYRSCSDRRLRQDHACLYFHIHRCLAPCIAACTPAAYREMVTEMAAFLDGKGEAVMRRLEDRMAEASDALQFEEAAELRDRIASLRSVLAKQKVTVGRGGDRDVIALARGEHGEAAVQVFFVRDGKIAGRDGFWLAGSEEQPDAQVLDAFVTQFYTGGVQVPPELMLELPLPDATAVAAMLRERSGQEVHLVVPRRGAKRRLVEMVGRNAAEYLTAEIWRRGRSRDAVEQGLAELAEALGLPGPPRRIECYDNSNIHGVFPVSAMVVLEDGLPRPTEYRKFRVKTVSGPDDFATMREVISRRFARGLRERHERLSEAAEEGAALSGFAHLPDLVLIDGGRGQLRYARDAMRQAGVGEIPTFALAKENEWLFTEGGPDPVVLPPESPALRILQRARDEAHRFGIGYHRQLRGKAQVSSILEEVPGIGPKRRKALMERFRTLNALRSAAPEDVAAVSGMNRSLAEDLLAHLRDIPQG